MAGSVAEVFGLLLDMVKRRLEDAREVVMGMESEGGCMESKQTAVDDYLRKVVGCKENGPEKE